MSYTPKIIGFFCKWCTSAGADLAGVSRLQYPPNITPIRVLCSGRIDPLFILRALQLGADGVLMGGCHDGDCHYVSGNEKAQKRFDFLQRILDEMGLSDRVEFHRISASEGMKFQRVVTDFTHKISKLGPSPLQNTHDEEDHIVIDQNYRKKTAIRDVLVDIAKKMKFKLNDPLVIESESIMEGYGFPVRDPEKCVGCYACVSVCPENVITVEDVAGKRRYGTLHWGCMNCKECEEICPQEAIVVRPGFELKSFLEDTPIEDIHVELLECTICGEHFIPNPFSEDLMNKLNKNGVLSKIKELGFPSDLLSTCPDCRQRKIGEVIREVAAPKGGIA